MIKLLILSAVAYLFYRAFKSWFLLHAGPQKESIEKAAPEAEDVMVKDPVCEVYVPKREAVHIQFEGNDLYFCSDLCRNHFLEKKIQEQNPELPDSRDS
jgi:YHS domain-containing protein